MRKLKWPELHKFSQLKWKALYINSTSSETSAFVKSYKNLTFYWILRAGHMVSQLLSQTLTCSETEATAVDFACLCCLDWSYKKCF